MIKSKKQMYLVIGVFILVMLLTTITYAFFNYTRTGVANTIRVGRISFVSKNEETVTLNNLFPIDPESSDEVVLSGGTRNGYAHNSLYDWTYYWTMLPFSLSNSSLVLRNTGALSSAYVDNDYGIRPVISLKADSPVLGGSGTVLDPYIVE